MRTREGKIRSTQANANELFEHHTDWCGVLGYDERAQCACFVARPPLVGFETVTLPHPLVDVDVTGCIAWLSHETQAEFAESKVQRALELVASRKTFDPVKDDLNSFDWDRTHRLDRWLHTYLGVDDTEYVRLVGRKFLISAVARAMKPGCQVDHILVLEGAQSLGKSSAVRILAGRHFVSDPPPLGTKDAKEILNNGWIIEVSELAGMKKSGLESTKSFISQTSDTFRAPYARKSKKVPRRVVFVGTTNESQYLKDATGNRRFWPVACERLDRVALTRDREQLWAEAVVAYRGGETWYPTTEHEKKLVREAQQLRLEVDPWEEQILELAESNGEPLSVKAAMQHLQIPTERQDQRSQNRIARILTRHGYVRKQIREQGKQRWVYQLP